MNVAFLLAAAMVAGATAWFTQDRIMYEGSAFVLLNQMEHWSPTHKTVILVTGCGMLVTTISNEHAAVFAETTRQITVRKRFCGHPRVTSIA